MGGFGNVLYPDIDLRAADFRQPYQAVAVTRPHFEIDGRPEVDNRHAAAVDILQDDFDGFGFISSVNGMTHLTGVSAGVSMR